MLWLKRNIYFNELMKCSVSGDYIAPGDYYYEDDQDGMLIKATVYKDLQRKRKQKTWDYSKLNAASNEQEYRRMLKDATMMMLADTVLERKVAGKYDPNPGVEDEFVQDLYNQKTTY